MPSRRAAWRIVAHLGLWALLAAASSLLTFLGSDRTVVIASHETVVRPTLSRHVEVRTGPLLPDLRVESPTVLGAELTLGKTEAPTLDELVRRYAIIATRPQAQLDRVESALLDMAYDAAILGGLLGATPGGVWLLVGPARRRQLREAARRPAGIGVLIALAVALLIGSLPFVTTRGADREPQEWTSLEEYVGPGLSLPAELDAVQVRTDVTSAGAQRLIGSAVATYRTSKEWYADAAALAAKLDVRQPAEDETLVIVVSDRHDNIGMDPVARAIADAAGATAILDAGDDTSTGRPWEAFSLDSLNEAFSDLDRFAVTGNHDHGTFVGDYLSDLGWHVLEGEAVEGPDGAVFWGIDDPRSSGLGSWRDEPGRSFAATVTLVADEVCAADDRVSTLLVHDAALGSQALARGCADLVVGGHLHVRVGPIREVGDNGAVGYRYSTGTAGGAAYAIAVGSKLRRPAEVTLITYRDGRPVGIQPVVLRTDQRFEVHPYVELRYDDVPIPTAPETSPPAAS